MQKIKVIAQNRGANNPGPFIMPVDNDVFKCPVCDIGKITLSYSASGERENFDLKCNSCNQKYNILG